MLQTLLTVFVAELGHKTQLATMHFAAARKVSLPLVFAGASLALIAASALGVLAGGALSRLVSERQLRIVAGAAFILVGVWTLIRSSG